MTKLESDFVQSISTVANGNKPPHKTYNIPRVFWNEFQKWAEKEMRDLGMM